MASSINYAQDVKKIPCNLCKVSDEAVWFCKQCIKNLCDNCKGVHSNIPQCENHTVVSAIEGLKIDKNINTTCTTHKNQFDFFCRSCDLKICAACLAETHRQHDFSLLADHVTYLEGILKDKHDKKERDLQMVQQKVQCLEEHIIRYKEEMKACGVEMRTSAAQKRKQIDEMERKLQDILDKKEKEHVNKMESQLEELKTLESEHGKLLQSLNEHRSNTVPSAFIDFMKDLDKVTQSLDVDMTLELPNAQQFVKNESDTLNPGSLMNGTTIQVIVKTEPSNKSNSGAIQTANTGANLPCPDLKKELHVVEILSGKNFGSGIVSINVIDEDRVWIGVVRCKNVLLMNKLNTERKVDLPDSPTYTTMLTSGDLLVSCKATIKQVTLMGVKKDFADLSRECDNVLSMVATKENEIFACLQVTDGINKVVKLSCEGRKLLDVDNKMFTSPNVFQICNAMDGTYLICDQGKMVYIDHNGNFVRSLEYSGKMKDVHKIAVDNYKRIFGISGNQLLVFSSDGTLLHTYDIKSYKGVYSTYSLVIDRYNKVWIGLFKKVAIVTYL